MKVSNLESYKLNIYDVKDQLKQLIYSRSEAAFAEGDRARDGVTTIEQLERRRDFLREAFISSMGGLPPSDTPLNPQITGVLRGDGYTIEKIMFESRPQQWVTGNLYIPDGIQAPSGTVLHVCGHNPLAKHAELYQTVSLHLVRAGLIVFTIDPIGQGERLSYYDRDTKELHVQASTREHEYVGKQCLLLGDNLARYFIHDAMRAIDYLCTRPEVDPANIGITGCSGGGTQSSMMMLCDPRIAAAAPAAFIMNRESYMHAGQAQDAEQIWVGMTALGFDHEDILMAMAPRPVLVLAAEYDFFPIEGTRRTVERTSRFWDMYGEGTSLEYFEDPSIHTYSVPMAKAAAAFFSKHLLGQPLNCSWEGIEPVKPSELWCTVSGQVLGDRDDARVVYDANCDRLSEMNQTNANTPDSLRKEHALTWLRDRVYKDRKPCRLNPRRQALGQLEDLSVESLLWWSQEKLFNHGFMFRLDEDRTSPTPVTIALWPRGTRNIEPHLDWIRHTCQMGRAVLVLDISGDGAIMPNSITANYDMHDFYGTLHKFTTDLFWLDDSLAALRTFDVLRALDLIDHLHQGTSQDIHLYVEGRFCLYGQLAAMLDDRLQRVDVVDGMESLAELVRSRYYDSFDSAAVIIPGILQVLDLPDVERWTAASLSSDQEA